MAARSCLEDAIRSLQELHDIHGPGQGVEGAIRGFARCHWVSLRENDNEGCFWSSKIVQGILALGPKEQDPDDLFNRLLPMFEGESTDETDPVAMAAFHVGTLQRCDTEAAERFFTICLEIVKPGSYMRSLACFELGKLLLLQASRQEDALKWFNEAASAPAVSKPLATLASYYSGKALSKLGRPSPSSEGLENKDDLLSSTLAAMLDADAKHSQSSTAAPEEVLAAYEDARIQLAKNFLVSLERKLVEYTGSSCCTTLFLMQYLRLDLFTRYTILVDAKQGPGIPIEACFLAWELYRDARCEMLKLSAENDKVNKFYMDPKPHLEQGIEFMYSVRKAPELVPKALDSLVISQQIASKMANPSALFWSGAFIDDYVGSGYEDIASRLVSCFKKRSIDGETPEAWALFYLGRVGAVDGLVSDAQHELLKMSQQLSTGHLLGYHVAYALGNAAGTTMVSETKARMMERMKTCAVKTGIQEFIISSMLELSYVLTLSNKIESAMQVHSELKQEMDRFTSGPASVLGEGVIEFTKALRLNVCWDYKAANDSFGKAVEILKPLFEIQGRGTLGSYLQTRNECLSQQGRMCLETVLKNATSLFKVRDKPSTSVAKEGAGSNPEFYLHMDYDHYKNKTQDLNARIAALKENEDLERADEEARTLLEDLQSSEYTDIHPRHELAAFSSSLWIMRAETVVKRFERLKASNEKQGGLEEELARDQAIAKVDEFMALAMEAATRCINSGPMEILWLANHGLLMVRMGRDNLAIPWMESGLRKFMGLDPDLGNMSSARISYVDGVKHQFRILQKCFLSQGDLRRALIWSEREHARDFIYSLGKSLPQDHPAAAAGFDEDDERAWLEIQGISTECGSESVILVVNHLNTGTDLEAYLVLLFLLHNGEIVKHALTGDELPRVANLLTLIHDGGRGQRDQLLRFHNLIVDPFAQELQEIQPKRIIFVPSQDLALFPYTALMYGEEKFLIEKYSISVVPSLRLLKHCTSRLQELTSASYQHRSKSALVVGNPITPGYKELDCAMDESEGVTEALQEAGFDPVKLLQASEATKKAILPLLPECEWIHLACHCEEVGDENPEGALVLAADDEDTGNFKLSSQEIAGKCRLRASAAVLSACSSGVGQRVYSAEGILALPRSFHLAGVPSVVMSLWKVNDDPTLELMGEFYSRLHEGMNLGDALQGAVVEAIGKTRSEEVPNSTVIKDWAAFIISGSPFTTLR